MTQAHQTPNEIISYFTQMPAVRAMFSVHQRGVTGETTSISHSFLFHALQNPQIISVLIRTILNNVNRQIKFTIRTTIFFLKKNLCANCSSHFSKPFTELRCDRGAHQLQLQLLGRILVVKANLTFCSSGCKQNNFLSDLFMRCQVSLNREPPLNRWHGIFSKSCCVNDLCFLCSYYPRYRHAARDNNFCLTHKIQSKITLFYSTSTFSIFSCCILVQISYQSLLEQRGQA